MIVTTLPITPGKHNSFVTLFSPLIADIFAKLTKCQFKMVLNTVHSFRSFEKFTGRYLEQLKRLNAQPAMSESDNCENYQKQVVSTVKDLMMRGFVTIQKINIVFCSCGVVELPFSVYKTLRKQSRCKYIRQSKCVNCGSNLTINIENILKLKLPKTKPQTNIPSLYARRFEQSCKSLEEYPLIISRNHREGINVLLQKQLFKLDADFCWMMYLIYLNEDEFCIISGSDTINHVARAIKLTHLCKPRVKVNLIIHPLLKPVDSKIKLSDFTIDEYLDYCGTARFARTFLMLGAQWQQPEVIIKARDLHLVEKSIYPKQTFNEIGNPATVTPKNFYNIVNSNKILELLKIMRSYKTKLNATQMKLKDVLLD